MTQVVVCPLQLLAAMRSPTCLYPSLALVAGLSATLIGCATDDDGPLGPGTLPAYSTSDGKADGPDPRDAEPAIYGFTAAPTDVIGLAGEFEPVQELFLSWPLNAFGDEDVAVTGPFYDIAKAAVAQTTVTILVQDEATIPALRKELRNKRVPTTNIRIAAVPIESAWVRDWGPVMVRTMGDPRVIDFRYFPGRLPDDAVPTKLAPEREWNVTRPPLDLEGGNLLSDGEGLCITSEQTKTVNAGRNVAAVLKSFVGCDKTIIVPRMIGMEQTGHVDMFMTLPAVGKALVGQITDPANADDRKNATNLDKAADILKAAGLQVTRVPMPRADFGGFRSYLNLVPINDVVLVPVYPDAAQHQARALTLIRGAFPGKTIVPIDASRIIRAGGALHCVTMTHPQ